jgi:hypothetical protein
MGTISNELRGGTNGYNVSLAADTTFDSPTRMIKCIGAGDLKVDFSNGRTGVLWPFAAGEKEVMQVTKIYSTGNGTTATGVWVLF